MTLLAFVLSLGVISIAAGMLGSLVGLGGGVLIVPVLVRFYDVDIRLAIGASIVSVIATSSGAAAAYVRDEMTNLRAGMFLEIATTLGAVSGAYFTTLLPTRFLYVLFGVVLAYSALATYRHRHATTLLSVSHDRLANYFKLHGHYHDEADGRDYDYKVQRTGVGLAMMYVAGMVSALLGIGSGALKVPAMDLAMRMPMKVSTATSNFMIGVTAAASAGMYFERGQINPVIAAPVAIGVLLGSMFGARYLGRATNRSVRLLFVIVLIVVAAEMLQRGVAG
ncbi:sulfite exporter TauE/SafE family protein [Metallibacterium sp.]|uniref:sulfite exporter TauE/SafE family protein n=1 Tax=Metallibacterium sp. TaxID=2940281 RepID=UPI00260B9343|nr:sulfite exporter TauE/SafE family protein [Metallibacterium sp.]